MRPLAWRLLLAEQQLALKRLALQLAYSSERFQVEQPEPLKASLTPLRKRGHGTALFLRFLVQR